MPNQSPILITTAIEETWSYDVPVVFLGEWCRMYARQSAWKNMDAVVIPFHWDDREKLKQDYDYLCDLYERVLRRLASHLNEIHEVNYSLRYWRILVGPWLAYFIHILFDRWESIQQSLKDYTIAETIVLTWPKESMVPASMEQFFSEFMAGHEWNHTIYGYILENFTTVKCVKKIRSEPIKKLREEVGRKKNAGIKSRILAKYSKLAAHFVKNTDIFVIATYLSAFDEFKLQLKFRQIPQLWTKIPPVDCAIDFNRRKWAFEISEENEFEKCLLSLIPMQIPAVYLEGYQEVIEQAKDLPWPKSPRLLFTSNVLWHDTVSMVYTAWHVEQGAKLVYGQHGGFGLQQFVWSEKHEREISDRYLTWGWDEMSSTNISPVGILKPLNKYIERNNTSTDRLLLVRGLWPPYIYRLDSGVGLPQLLANIDDCIKFAGLLPVNLCNNSLIVRLYPLANAFSSDGRKADQSATDFYCEELRWKSAFPKVQLSDGSDPISKLVVKSKLIIYTYNGGTGYLEFMAADLPVIAFWDMTTSPIRDSAIPYFDELKRVGIFHDTPESAAAHVAEIWEDVDGWWKSIEVQEVLLRFKARYCHKPDSILDNVVTALRATIV
jgi:putative transferase (TIGR04331 family)